MITFSRQRERPPQGHDIFQEEIKTERAELLVKELRRRPVLNHPEGRDSKTSATSLTSSAAALKKPSQRRLDNLEDGRGVQSIHHSGIIVSNAIMPQQKQALPEANVEPITGKSGASCNCMSGKAEEIPLVLSVQACKTAPMHILCEMPGNLDIDGDSGVVGRVCRPLSSAQQASGSVTTGEHVCMDLKGTLYRTDMVDGASTLLLMHVPNSGKDAGKANVEAIFSTFLRASSAEASPSPEMVDWRSDSDEDPQIGTPGKMPSKKTKPKPKTQKQQRSSVKKTSSKTCKQSSKRKRTK
ncbi:hypothetical protein COCOBI_04-3600 [Coccomyxa sp. Obi]|nr:hypothetical protein COCOBI_04-3600 [Coccomyxa sp. Obi]